MNVVKNFRLFYNKLHENVFNNDIVYYFNSFNVMNPINT